MGLKDHKDVIHVGPLDRQTDGTYANPIPPGEYYVASATDSGRKVATRYLQDVDAKNNPIYTTDINECAKFTKWSSIKTVWRGTTQRLPKEMPMAHVRLEKQAFGKGPDQKIISAT